MVRPAPALVAYSESHTSRTDTRTVEVCTNGADPGAAHTRTVEVRTIGTNPAERFPAVTCPPATSPPGTSPAQELERLGDEIAELAAHLHAAIYRLLVLIREFDAREGWHSGFRTCAHWLSWRTGIDMGAAREKVRVARALEHLPLLSEAMRSGELSYSKARALTRVATAENEEELMVFAEHATASHVETLVRTWRRVDRLEEQCQEQERHRSRFLTVHPDVDGMYVVRGRLDPEVGALLTRALEAAGDELYRRPAEDDPVGDPQITGDGVAVDTVEGSVAAEVRSEVPSEVRSEEATTGQRQADAIGLLAERALQGGLVPAECALRGGLVPDEEEPDEEEPGDGPELGDGRATASVSRAGRFQVVLHVDAQALGDPETLKDGSGAYESELEDGVRVSAETSRRLACDASRVVMTHGTDGTVLDVGRKTRTVPPAIRRALDRRDKGCRFPGCGLRFCDAHHIEHWADGGETRLDNLVLLCRLHHRAVHEEGFGVAFTGDGRVHFRWPDGQAFPDAPQAPRLTGDPVTALERKHERMELGIDPWTSTALWRGESLDLGLAIEMFRNHSAVGASASVLHSPASTASQASSIPSKEKRSR